jgi:hypothetical protein
MSGARRGHRQLGDVRASLSDRDRAVLGVVYSFRLATGAQLRQLFYPAGDSDARACRRALQRLTELDVICRLRRRIGGVRAGSDSYLYSIGPLGERILRIEGPRRRLREPSWAFVDHTLCVLDCYIEVVKHCHAQGAEVLSVETEPACWRNHSSLGQAIAVRPDLYVILGAHELELRWFIEIDRATEHLPAIVRKCAAYERYYRSGVEQDRHGVFPRVMWITTSADRANRIAHELSTRPLTTGLFHIDTLERAVARLLGSAK